MNQALLALATPVPAVIRHHDHWIALCAAACGMIESDTAALVQYRQHGANAIGGRKLWRSWRAKPSRLAVKIRHHRDDIRRLPELLDALQQRCGSEAPEHARSLLAQAETVAARRTSGLARYNGYKRLGIAPHDGARHLLWLMKNLIS